MSLKKLLNIVGFAALFIAAGLTAYSQSSSELWISVQDDAGVTDFGMLYFGNHVNGTFGIDSLNPTIIEKEGPPKPPGFDARFVNIAGRTNSWGLGLITYDFREFLNATQKDTFKVAFVNGEISSANFTFKWPAPSYIAARCDSLVLVYFNPDVSANVRVNLATAESLYVAAAGDNNVSTLTIYKYGCVINDAVKQENNTIPGSFNLYQNFPNPFNPSTTVKFDIQKRALTDISVFNMIGQKVVTLVAQELAPGTYNATWNGTTAQGSVVSTGVYFMRMVAHTNGADGKAEEFSALQKLLFIK